MRRFNCCLFNHPCPIFCPFVNLECENEIVNPPLGSNFVFLNNTGVGSIEASAVIPVNLVSLSGNAFLPNNGGVTLPAGNYEINYFVSGTVPTNGTFAVGLLVGGTLVPTSVISSTATAGQSATLTRTLVLSLPTGGNLQIGNQSQTTTFDFASLFVRQL